ncbi:MAG: hypothetical protein RL095_3716 [Verrucomicrobiota bacterium]|jgi:hypothetical protein
MKLAPSILPASQADAAELFALFAQVYDAVDESRFRDDLAAKDDVICFRDETGQLRGFSTQVIHRCGEVRLLFSGDTVIDPACWGSQALARAWCAYAGRRQREEASPLFWLLLSKGWRTYLYLPLFFRNYLPHPSQTAPAEWLTLRDAACRQLFGAAWLPELGILRFPESLGQLKPDFARPRRSSPEINFFLQLNPGYAEGDELVGLAPIAPGNMLPRAAAWMTEDLP